MRRMRPRGHFAFAVLVAASGLAKVAHADATSPVALQWGAPPGCPSQADVERDIARTIGGRPVGREPLRARVDVWRSEGGGWKGEVELTAGGESARRRVHGDSCAAVESAVAIVIGVAAVHDAIPSSERASVAAPIPAPAPPAAPPPEALPFPPQVAPQPHVEAPPAAFAHPPAPALVTLAAPPRHTASRPVPLYVGASALLDLGSLPSAAPGVELVAGWRPAWWRVELTAAYLASTFVSLHGAEGADVWLADLGGRACAAWTVARVDLGPCAGAAAALTHAAAVATLTSHPQLGDRLDTSFGGHASWHVTRWAALHLGGDLVVPLERTTVNLSGLGPDAVYRTAAAAFRGALGVEAHF